jgi:hypothetical protein
MQLTRKLAALALGVAIVCSSTGARAALEPRAPKKLALETPRLAMNTGAQGIPFDLLGTTLTTVEEPPSEVGRAIGEYFAGVGLQLVGLIIAVLPLVVTTNASFSDFRGPALVSFGLMLFGAPALSSLGVWGIADASHYYEASYLLTWLGGIAASGLAIGILVASAAGKSTASGFDSIGALGGWAIWLLPPLGETILANVTKEPELHPTARRPPPMPVQPVEVLVRGEQPRTDRVVSFPLVSLALP